MPARVAPVTAVLVAHDGGRWLPDVLAALAAQTVRPARVVAVDTGSRDDGPALLRRATGDVLELPRDTGYAEAVHTALAGVPADSRWIWLLHDDCAPAPDALELLLRHAASSPSAAVLGPKALDWAAGRRLVELGLSVDRGGHVVPAVEPGELDQGQHDAPRDVLAVGTAGALVQREVWDRVGGLERALPLLRDELDLGWRVNAAGARVVVVPAARVRHAQATVGGARSADAVSGRTLRADRRGAIEVLLWHAAGWRLAPALAWLVLATLLRALALLLRRAPGEAVDELAALGSVLLRPGRLRRARRARAATRTVPPGALRPLRPRPLARWRARWSTRLERLAEGRPRLTPAAQAGLLLGLVLGAVTLGAARDLLGSGLLQGGRLLPASGEVGDLWAARDSAPPLAVVAALAVLLLGSPGAAVDLLLLGAVPLAGAVAYAVAGRATTSPLLRVWAAATWALLPVATGAVAAGRLDAAVLHVGLPAVLLAAHRVATRDPREVGWAPAWQLGLALGVAALVAPLLWPLAAALLLGGTAAAAAAVAPARRPAARRRLAAAAVAAGAALLLLVPWGWGWLGDPARLVHGPGRISPALAEPALPFAHLLLLSPGGPGLPAVATTAGLLLAAAAGLLRRRRAAQAVAAGWALALVGLGVALLLARIRPAGAPVWPGVPLEVAAAGLLLAAVVAGNGARDQLGRSAFGWRQLTAVLVVAAAAAVPVLAAAQWLVDGAGQPLRRGPSTTLPAFARAELAAEPGRRALLLTERTDGAVGYAVADADGRRLGDAEAAESDRRLEAAVGELLAPRGAPAAAAVAARGVRFVALDGAADGPVARALDAQPGLVRDPGRRPLWRVLPQGAPVTRRDGLPAAVTVLQALSLLLVVVLALPARPRRPAVLT